ncbi:MAG TPA: RDD family protein [Streptosporangiaceae bacterium]|nr:RDD family protein [Streptosporangiaceae bacterium]
MTDLVTGEAVVLDVPCARFPSRLVAIIIDMAAQILLVVGLLLILGASGAHLNAASLAAVALSLLILVFVGYPTIFETLSRGRTLGKLALGLRVVGDDGGPERFRQALVRALAAVVEIWLFFGAPALICSLLSDQGKRLGDLFAGTFVIQERLPRRQSLPPLLSVVPPPLADWSQGLQLSRLDDQTAEQAASYLRRFYELTPAAREEFGQRIAAAVAALVTPPPPPGTPPAAFLSAVLAVRRQREAARLAAQQAAAAPYPPPPAAPAPAVPQPTAPAAALPPAHPPLPPASPGPGGFAPPV